MKWEMLLALAPTYEEDNFQLPRDVKVLEHFRPMTWDVDPPAYTSIQAILNDGWEPVSINVIWSVPCNRPTRALLAFKRAVPEDNK
jgi:hypothetical protein